MKNEIDNSLEDFDYLLRFLKRLQKDKYYGSLILQIQKGEIVLIRNESTIKPNDLKILNYEH